MSAELERWWNDLKLKAEGYDERLDPFCDAFDATLSSSAGSSMPAKENGTYAPPSEDTAAASQATTTTTTKTTSESDDVVVSSPRKRSVLNLLEGTGKLQGKDLPEWIRKHVESGSKIIRVFFSSPFGGMEEERNILTKLYFPELRSMCERAGLTFVGIDLRWGITEQNAQDALVIQICLKEIERSELFVGFYGQRYGWHGNDDLLSRNFDAAKEDFPWIMEYRDRSVTEIEFLAGHFKTLGEKSASFYFRDPNYDHQRCREYESQGDERSARKYRAESEQAAVLRDKLFDAVAATAAQCTFHREKYASPEDGARLMFEDLKRKLQPRILLANLERANRHEDAEAAQHEIFMHLRAKMFVGMDDYFKHLDAYIQEGTASEVSTPLVLTGDHGTGKTSLLAKWILQQEAMGTSNILFHYVGCSSRSTTLVEILQRFTKLLAKAMGSEFDPTDMDLAQLTSKFSSFLERAGAHVAANGQGPVVVVIDALDEMQPDHRAHELSWLPDKLPAGIKLVVSAVNGSDVMSRLRDRQWSLLELKDLPKPTLEQIMNNQLKTRGKDLSMTQRQRILSNPASGNALYLIVLVTELCQFGVFERLDEKIDECLKARDPRELFVQVLARLDADFSKDGEPKSEGSIAKVMSALALSRNGLTEPEIMAIVDLSGPAWARLYFALEELLVTRSGLLCIRRKQLLEAVLEHYELKAKGARQAVQRRLAAYFDSELSKGRCSLRVVSELPWLYEQLEDVSALRRCITHPGVFNALSVELGLGNYDLLRYWRVVGDSPDQIVSVYMQHMDDQLETSEGDSQTIQDIATACARVGQYLAEAGHYQQAMKPFERALELEEALSGDNSEKTASILSSIARLHSSIGDVAGAMQYYSRALPATVQHFGEDSINTANILVGMAIASKGEEGQQDDALEMLTQAKSIYESKLRGDHPDVAMVLNLMGEILKEKGDMEAAKKAFESALLIRQQAMGVSHPTTAVTLGHLGDVYLAAGDVTKAKELHQRALSARQVALGEAHPETAASMIRLGMVAAASQDIEQALRHLKSGVNMLETSLGKEHLALCEPLDTMASLLQQQERASEALEVQRKSIGIKEACFGSESGDVAYAYYGLAQTAMQLGNFPLAMEAITKVHDVSRAAYGDEHPMTLEAAEKMDLLRSLMESEH